MTGNCNPCNLWMMWTVQASATYVHFDVVVLRLALVEADGDRAQRV